ncbi:hypothetical protein ACIHDR_45405 [Nocardia sp. NPDC052278]|uniref:hypothetical protein n=1 Tax=unclassified Nocardia TaxID=2637762 RepID=UPI0036AF2253
MADDNSLTISKVLGWDLRYLGQVVDMMNETYKFIETEATAAGKAIEQSGDYFDSSAGDAARRRGQEDRTDTVQTSDVIEQMASKLSSLVSTLETNIFDDPNPQSRSRGVEMGSVRHRGRPRQVPHIERRNLPRLHPVR